MPKDPDPKAAQRVARERIDELAAQLGVAEVVELEEAVDALIVIEDSTSELISDEVLLSAARRYLRRRRSSGEEPGPEEILSEVQAELAE